MSVVIQPRGNLSERTLWNGEQPPLSCPGLCIQIAAYDFKLRVRVSLMCVSACRPAGLGNRWRFRASSADAGVSEPSQGAASLGGKGPLLTAGPGCRTDVMELAFSSASLSPAVCCSGCLSVAQTVGPPAYLWHACLIHYFT